VSVNSAGDRGAGEPAEPGRVGNREDDASAGLKPASRLLKYAETDKFVSSQRESEVWPFPTGFAVRLLFS